MNCLPSVEGARGWTIMLNILGSSCDSPQYSKCIEFVDAVVQASYAFWQNMLSLMLFEACLSTLGACLIIAVEGQAVVFDHCCRFTRYESGGDRSRRAWRRVFEGSTPIDGKPYHGGRTAPIPCEPS